MLGVPHPTVQIPSWPPSDDPTVYIHSPLFSVNSNPDFDSDSESDSELYSSDYFRMYEFKVRKCMRARSHDWTECPYAHPGEKARRRDPRKYSYSGTACPDFRKGSCEKGESCEYAHGVFECWLHPSRYRTQPCKDGVGCTRRVCFFAHSVEQLRVVSPGAVLGLGNSVDGSPPMSPVSEVVRSMRSLQLSRMNSLPTTQQWNIGGVFGSTGPSTPTRGYGFKNVFEDGEEEEEPVMERVESGRDLRMKMFERILSGSGC